MGRHYLTSGRWFGKRNIILPSQPISSEVDQICIERHLDRVWPGDIVVLESCSTLKCLTACSQSREHALTIMAPDNPNPGPDGKSVQTHQRSPLTGWGRLRIAFGLARIRGGSLGGAARLFYHAGLKPSLVYRKWTSFDAERVVQVPLALGRNKKWTVSVRDNELDMRTLTEFFCQNAGVTKEIPEREPAVIYDIGANIGISSLLFASRCPHARIYGFEPLPSNYRMCSMNYQNLEHAQAFPWAIGAASGVTAFEFEVNDNRGGRLATSAMGNSPTNTQRITVDVVSIADLIEKKR